MRIAILISSLFFSILSVSCQRSTAGLTIPPRQTFILGEYAQYGYDARLRNDGKEAVTVQLRDKTSGAVAKTVELAPGSKESFAVEASQEVTLANETDRKAKVYVVMSEEVQGMRYVANDGGPLEREVTEDDVRVALLMAPPTDAAPAPATEEAFTKLAAGETFVLGEGTEAEYSAKLSRLLGDIEVSVRDRETGEQTQSFGLGRTATVYIRPYEVIYLVNAGSRSANVRAVFSQPVSGARVVELR